jgi:hypothetical protein
MRYYLCGGGKPCCPSIEELSNGVVIRDDYDGIIVVTKEEFKQLQNFKLKG